MNIIEELRNTSKLVDTFGTEGDGNLHLKAADEIEDLTNRLHAMGNVLGKIGEYAGVQAGDYDGLIKWADTDKQRIGGLKCEYIIMLPVCVETGEIDYDYLRYKILTKEKSENYDNALIPGWEYKEFKIIPSA